MPPPNPVYYQPWQTQQQPYPSFAYQTPAPQPVVSVYVDPPLMQPPPIQIGWAPPPMLVETPPPMPYPDAAWTGGYWTWEGNWVWAHGRWLQPPHPGYNWVNPYYEHRGGEVVFINGFWAAPGVVFMPPPPNIYIALAEVALGVIPGPRPIGPEGVFIPPPPGSHFGLIVPAPIGTAPAVITSAPPIINQGMYISHTTNITNITNVTNIHNVTIIAPANSTANGQAFNHAVPGDAHLAAALPAMVKAVAPEPASPHPIPAYTPGRPLTSLPAAQMVHPVVPPGFTHQAPAETMHPTAPHSESIAAPLPYEGYQNAAPGSQQMHPAPTRTLPTAPQFAPAPEPHFAAPSAPVQRMPAEPQFAPQPEPHFAAPPPVQRMPEPQFAPPPEPHFAAPPPVQRMPAEPPRFTPPPEPHFAAPAPVQRMPEPHFAPPPEPHFAAPPPSRPVENQPKKREGER